MDSCLSQYKFADMTFSNVLQHYFEMEDGVIHVYENKDCKILQFIEMILSLSISESILLFFSCSAKEKLFPVVDATTFFTDLHHILKVIAAGNTRTVCHHRLGLLEQVDTLILRFSL